MVVQVGVVERSREIERKRIIGLCMYACRGKRNGRNCSHTKTHKRTDRKKRERKAPQRERDRERGKGKNRDREMKRESERERGQVNVGEEENVKEIKVTCIHV